MERGMETKRRFKKGSVKEILQVNLSECGHFYVGMEVVKNSHELIMGNCVALIDLYR